MNAKEFLKEKGISNNDFMDSGVADLIETLLTEYQVLQLQQTGVSGSFFSVCYSTNEGIFFVDEEENQTKLKEKAKKFKSRKEAEMYIDKELCGFGNVINL